MNNYIRKFEALSSFNVNELLKEYDMTISDLDNIINKIGKYNIFLDLYTDMNKSKLIGYRDLRKWKMENFLRRYNQIKPTIDKIEIVEDLLVGLTDLECKVKIILDERGGGINPYNGSLLVKFNVWKGREFKKINEVTKEFLQISNHMQTNITSIDSDAVSSHETIIEILLDYSVINI